MPSLKRKKQEEQLEDEGFDAFLRGTFASNEEDIELNEEQITQELGPVSTLKFKKRRKQTYDVISSELTEEFDETSIYQPPQTLKRKRQNDDLHPLPKVLSYDSMYRALYEHEMALKKKRSERSSIPRKHEYQLSRYSRLLQSSGDKRIRALRSALEQLDNMGFMRSAHQRQFHEAFIAACLPQIYGADLEKNLVRILRENNMEEIRCEIMVCCPRRWGKTMAVALYAAGYLWSQPDAEVLIYSIAKRTSSMLMAKIYGMIVKLAGGTHVIKIHNQEDLEIVNAYGQTSVCHSYPAASKISINFF
jgi:hypothetical protein